MMAVYSNQPLIVEGSDDQHTILHLLKRSQILTDDMVPGNTAIDIVELKSKKKLLSDLKSRAKGSGIIAIGYVIDADDDASEYKGWKPTWDAIRNRLTQLGIETDSKPPMSGFLGKMPKNGPKVGVWIMPDNQTDGALEDFLIPQVDSQNALYQFARAKTEEAGQLTNVTGRFAASDRSKAELHCWLAWSEEPGQPYGHAMRSGRFDVTREPAVRFCQWVRDLYGL